MKRGAFFIAAMYFSMGIVWIITSDWMLSYIALPQDNTTFVQTAKGAAYVSATSLLLFYLIKKYSNYLKERGVYLNSLLESQSNFLVRTNLQGNYTFANSAFCRKFGYATQQVIGRSCFSTVMHEDIEKVERMVIACMKNPGQIIPLQFRKLHRNGEIFTTRWEFVTITNAQNEVVEIQGVGQDITQEYAYYEQLTTTKERLEDILSCIYDVVWRVRVGEKYELEYISPACLHITGYTPEEFYASEELMRELIYPEDLNHLYQKFEELYDNEEMILEYRIFHKDGTIHYLSGRFKTTGNQQGLPVYINGVSSDITAKKEAERQAKETSNIREEILESITDGFFAVDKNWNFTYINKEFERLLKVQRQNLLGKNVWEIFPEAVNLKSHMQNHLAIGQDVSIRFEEFVSSANLWFKVSAYPTQDGLAVYLQDITREKELRTAVEQSKHNLYALINNTKDLIWSVDKDLRIVTANQLYRTFIKDQTNVIVHRGNKATPPGLEEQAAKKWEYYYRRALKGEVFSVEEQFTDAQGNIQYGEISFNPIRDDGEVMGVSCIAHDITGMKAKEARITRQNELLREIAFIQSHKLRRPVATIMGLAALLDIQDLSSDFTLEVIQKLQVVCQELDVIIHEIVEKTVELE